MDKKKLLNDIDKDIATLRIRMNTANDSDAWNWDGGQIYALEALKAKIQSDLYRKEE